MIKTWLLGLKYFAPDARKRIIQIKISDLVRYILAYPFLIIGFVLDIVISAIIALLALDRNILKERLSFWPPNLNIFLFFSVFFSEYCLVFKCKKCGRSMFYGIKPQELSKYKEDNGIWNWYNNKEKICLYCQKEEQP